MLLGIVIALVIPIVAGLLLWYTEWAESTVVATVPAPAGDRPDHPLPVT